MYTVMKSVYRMGKKKKTMMYIVLSVIIVYILLQFTQLNEAYSSLRVLANAESESRRLLKFITLYQYRCNTTFQNGNASVWPICTEEDTGLKVDSPVRHIAYSIGPEGDFSLEKILARNLTFQLFIFSHQDLPADIKRLENTHIYKTTIVPNDPSDFGRISYDTQTINNVLETLHHKKVDLMTINLVADLAHSHEILYFLVKDHLLWQVNQLHIAVHIDKLDEDYLYSWYRALHNLFHSGFRLYHTSASNSLCLQVTMMESCIYFTSWIRNPGPKTFVLYPPAIDGSFRYEQDRLVDHLETVQTSCKSEIEFSPRHTEYQKIPICKSQENLSGRKCHILMYSIAKSKEYNDGKLGCIVKKVQVTPGNGNLIKADTYHARSLTFEESLSESLSSDKETTLYLALHQDVWAVLTPFLDSGLPQNISQIILDIDICGPVEEDKYVVNLRRKFSELKRLESYGFSTFHASKIQGNTLKFIPHSQEDCLYRMGLINTMSWHTRHHFRHDWTTK